MLEHVEEHKTINKNQFRFLKNRSSKDTVISITQSIDKSVEQNATLISVF